MPARTSPTNSVQKACRILRSLSTPKTARLTDIATATSINKATALRILEILAGEGYVRRNDDNKTWSLGEEAYVIAASLGRSDDLRSTARAALVRLAAKSGDTVLLSIRSGMESVCVDREVGDFPIRANFLDIGTRRPLGVGAGSLALLAWASDEEIAALLPLIKPLIAPFPKLSVKLVEQEIERSRKRGYTLVLNTLVEQMGAIGVPVLSARGAPIAALSIAALSERISARKNSMVEWLQQEAASIASPSVNTTKVGRRRAPIL